MAQDQRDADSALADAQASNMMRTLWEKCPLPTDDATDDSENDEEDNLPQSTSALLSQSSSTQPSRSSSAQPLRSVSAQKERPRKRQRHLIDIAAASTTEMVHAVDRLGDKLSTALKDGLVQSSREALENVLDARLATIQEATQRNNDALNARLVAMQEATTKSNEMLLSQIARMVA